jgi:hypothetical protein
MDTPPLVSSAGTRDGAGAGDCDVPFRFGRPISSTMPFPFSTREFSRLLILRSRVQAGLFGLDDRGQTESSNGVDL